VQQDHHPAEVLVEQWDGERCVAVGWAVDHAFLEENRLPGCNALNADTELGSDVSAAVSAWSECCHCPEVLTFLLCEADSEEVRVEGGSHEQLGCCHIVGRDHTVAGSMKVGGNYGTYRGNE